MSEENEVNDGIVTESSTHKDSAPDVVAEVENTPEAEPVEAKPEETPEDNSDKAKRPGRRERQIERERQENQRLASENQRMQAELAKFQGQGTKPADGEPKLEDFEDVIEWSKAQAKWEVKQELSAYRTEQEAKAEEQYIQQRVSAHEEREAVFEEQYPDYEEKVDAIAQSGLVTPDIIKATLSSDMSEKIAYHLAQHPQDLYVMAQMGNNQVALKQAIKTIESYIEANPITAVKQTRAAAPITPVNGKSATSSKDPGEMSQREYEAWRYK